MLKQAVHTEATVPQRVNGTAIIIRIISYLKCTKSEDILMKDALIHRFLEHISIINGSLSVSG
jgi:hypothetical protein